jgi:hypothetical protein
VAFLVLGDIHFGSQSVHPDFGLGTTPPVATTPSPASIKASLIEVCKNSPDFDVQSILVPGDLTSGAGPSEFVDCVDTVLDIAKQLNVPQRNVIFSLGNHDVNWRVSALAKGNSCLPDERYRELAAHAGLPFMPGWSPDAQGPVPRCGVTTVEDCLIVVLNSGFLSTDAQEFPHGKLGQEQMKWLEQTLKGRIGSTAWNIVLLHHHPQKYSYPTPIPDVSMIEEGSEFLDIVGQIGVDVVVHGHRHHPMVFTEHRTGWKHPVTFLCAGSVGVGTAGRATGVIPNTFHVFRLDERGAGGASIGTAFHFECGCNGWEPAYSHSLPMDGRQRFGVLVDQTQLDTLAQDVIQHALREPDLRLPVLADLPIALQCMRHSALNALIHRHARTSRAKFYGEYPDTSEPILVVP